MSESVEGVASGHINVGVVHCFQNKSGLVVADRLRTDHKQNLGVSGGREAEDLVAFALSEQTYERVSVGLFLFDYVQRGVQVE